MRYVYAHFPINVNIEKNNDTGLYEVEIRYEKANIESGGELCVCVCVCERERERGECRGVADVIFWWGVSFRNFIGEKIVRRVTMHPGVDVETSKNQKDEIQLTGISLENVSQSAADIQQICRVRNKDIRKVGLLFQCRFFFFLSG